MQPFVQLPNACTRRAFFGRSMAAALTGGLGGAIAHASLAQPVPDAPSVSPADRLARAVVEKIEQKIAAEMSRQQIPGCSVAVVAARRLAWANGFGMADLENFVPVVPETVFCIASTSKLITATAALQLVEKDKLALEAPIQKYVPSFPEKPWPITIRHLLCHTSGLRHYRGPEERFGLRHYDELLPILDFFKNEALIHQPGNRFTYSSPGYILLGCAIETAAGKRFADYLRDQLFQPAGMRHTRADDARALIPRRARGYRHDAEGTLQNAPPENNSMKVPAGGICSTAPDLARYGIGLLTATLLKQPTLEQMGTVARTNDGKPVGENRNGTFHGMGLGVSVLTDARERRVLRHGGTQSGMRSLLHILPSQETAVAITANLQGAELDPLAREIVEIVLT